MPGRFFLFPAMTKALSLAQSLINCPSVTPDEAGTIRLPVSYTHLTLPTIRLV